MVTNNLTEDEILGRSIKNQLTRSDAQDIAIKALTFLAGNEEHMSRFMALSGLGAKDILANAAQSGFQIALLEHLMSDEALLLSFCGNENIDPELIAPAFALLGGTQEW